jgi:hypothetical protein
MRFLLRNWVNDSDGGKNLRNDETHRIDENRRKNRRIDENRRKNHHKNRRIDENHHKNHRQNHRRNQRTAVTDPLDSGQETVLPGSGLVDSKASSHQPEIENCSTVEDLFGNQS